MVTIIERVKMALRIKGDAYDDELEELIESALLDLGIAGVENIDESFILIRTAIVTYCKLHFGTPDNADRLKASYDEQKAQLSMCSDYIIEVV